jgi:Ca2+-binding RTX toxin-like protein
LYGRAGNDVLIGGTGFDFLYGGSGADLIYGGGLFDGTSDEEIVELWMLWRTFAQDDAIAALGGIYEDDGNGDLLNGERDADWYAFFAEDRIATTAESRSPNQFVEL